MQLLWHVRMTRPLVYAGAAIAGATILVMAWFDRHELIGAAVEARQLLGLWALAFLLGSLIVGPLVAVVPWLPGKSHLVYARRAAGVSAFFFAVAHVLCYLVSPWRRGWHELWTPGVMWVVGLLLGLVALTGMGALALTSRDAAVKRMGGRQWKRLHRTSYWLLLVVLVHGVCNGADFGVNPGPDVKGHPDAGAAFGFFAVSAGWVVLFLIRKRGWRLGRRGNGAGQASYQET